MRLLTALETLQDDSNLENAEDVAAAAAAAFRSSLTRTTSQPVEDDLPEEEAEEGEIDIPVRRSFTACTYCADHFPVPLCCEQYYAVV